MRRIPAGAIPGVIVLPYWQAKYYSPGAIRSVDAIVWHFAQGGGTDSWLLHPSSDNSCHIVIKYTGAIRQMVEFDDASHSLHINRPDGPPGTGDYGIFSLDAVQKALGAEWRNPNTQIIAIEVEGFAADGPNAAQKKTIVALARFLEELFPRAVHLGHRDFQNYKPCPGPTLFRGLLPHGARLTQPSTTPTEADPMLFYERRNTTGRFTIKPGTAPRGFAPQPDGSWKVVKQWSPIAAVSGAPFDYHLVRIAGTATPSSLLHVPAGFFAGLYVSTSDVDEVFDQTELFTKEQLQKAVAEAEVRAAGDTTALRNERDQLAGRVTHLEQVAEQAEQLLAMR